MRRGSVPVTIFIFLDVVIFSHSWFNERSSRSVQLAADFIENGKSPLSRESLHGTFGQPIPEDDGPTAFEEDGLNQCVPIDEPICQGLEYTHTRFPNSVGLTSQEEASKRVNDYRALISVECSHYLRIFLCTVYFPMCTPTPNAFRTLQPCQSFCRHVQSKCEPIMKSFSFPWPKELNCNALPVASDMCIKPQSYDQDQATGSLTQKLPEVASNEIAKLLPGLNNFLHEHPDKMKDVGKSAYSSIGGNLPLTADTLLQIPQSKSVPCTIMEVPLVRGKSNGNVTCARRCTANIFYRAAEKRFADIWLLGWSILCAISCLLTIVTFIIDRSRFVYPERPIVYISACYLFYSVGCILRIIVGRERVSCYQRADDAAVVNSQNTIWANILPTLAADAGGFVHSFAPMLETNKFLIVSGYESTSCTLIFIIIYYFGQASYGWWVMLAVTWFLSTACKWGSEGVERVSSILHMFAWAVPAITTMIILILHRIDADELTGLCYVGYQDRASLLIFVLIPQIVCLLLGLGLFVIGFFSLISIRTNLKRSNVGGTKNQFLMTEQSPGNGLLLSSRTPNPERLQFASDKVSVRRLDKLMAKICIFSVLYVIPCICVIGANWYSYSGQDTWLRSMRELATRSGCVNLLGTNWNKADECLQGLTYPSIEVHMLHTFMSLVVGITAGMWVWCNRKTFSTWVKCIRRQQNKPGKCVGCKTKGFSGKTHSTHLTATHLETKTNGPSYGK
ncbi:hypothetical protein T265_08477 [Opisthorchis viverrini]|uniref:Uncharacterized protein n=2 Tax=Opisthorchis viverrini TaxID=6198 RepID=A0A074Z9D5_OPIVI|nr:hypothetical protein T265_08477 [Opisthorchis viverrini]KER23713.1 hypothetical protein T265_08477 [Opisthorchis viverrini]